MEIENRSGCMISGRAEEGRKAAKSAADGKEGGAFAAVKARLGRKKHGAKLVKELGGEARRRTRVFVAAAVGVAVCVGGRTLDYIPVTVNGVQMLPVRQVAEALGYEVGWINESRTVTVGFASFSIDEDGYAFAKMAPQALGQAPVLICLPGDDSALTYVPAAFFPAIMDCQMAVNGDTLVIANEGEEISTMPMYQKIAPVPGK